MRNDLPGQRFPPPHDPRIGKPRPTKQLRIRSRLAYLSLLILGAGAVYFVALISADALLAERNAPEPADIIVVLGGDGLPRAERAAGLWRDGMGPSILVTGAGDCEFVRSNLISAGVDASAITSECRSQTTWENATFSRPLLVQMGIQRAILVTSWFHSKRAVKRFRSSMPNIQWISLPTDRTKSLWSLAGDVEGVQVVKEYAKIVAYDLRGNMSEIAPPTAGAAPKTSRLP